MRHFIDLLDWDGEQILKLLKDAARLKKAHLKGKHKPRLAGQGARHDLREAVAAHARQLPGRHGPARRTEQFSSTATRSAWASARASPTSPAPSANTSMPSSCAPFSTRTSSSSLAGRSKPVINGLSDYYHPCQALGDLLTVRECCGELEGKTLVFVGDGNNVARSLAVACGKLGVQLHPVGAAELSLRSAVPRGLSRRTCTAQLEETTIRVKAVAEADVIYTDVWASMGQEEEANERGKHFEAYQVNAELLKAAPGACEGDALLAGPSRRGNHRRGARRPAVGRVPASGQPHARPEGAVGCGRWTLSAFLAASFLTKAACSGEASPSRKAARKRLLSQSSNATGSSQSPGYTSERKRPSASCGILTNLPPRPTCQKISRERTAATMYSPTPTFS